MTNQPWNINIHYDALLADLAPAGARVLDVGCGDGFLSARLAAQGCDVVGLDLDEGVLERARRRWPDAGVSWLQGDVLTYPFAPGEFDAVLSNAALHHLPDTAEALRRFAALVRPGGRVGVVGFARNSVRDWPLSLIGAVAIFVAVRVRGKWEHTAPLAWPPPLSYGQVKQVAADVLPGSAFRRLLFGRYALTWTRPGPGTLDG